MILFYVWPNHRVPNFKCFYYFQGGYLKSTQIAQKELEEKEFGETQNNTQHTKMEETERMQTEHTVDKQTYFNDEGSEA